MLHAGMLQLGSDRPCTGIRHADHGGASRGLPIGEAPFSERRSKDSKNAFNALGCDDGNFEQTVLYPVASISFIPGPKQRLPCHEGY